MELQLDGATSAAATAVLCKLAGCQVKAMQPFMSMHTSAAERQYVP
jgi:hypothetical protein